MPPVNPQGSRGALVAWMVVCSVGFVASLIFAIYFYVAMEDARKQLTTARTQYSDVVADVAAPEVTELKTLRSEPPAGLDVTANTPVYQVALAQRDRLARLLGGTDDFATAANAATEALKSAAAQLKDEGVSLPTSENLAQGVRTMTNTVVARRNEIQDLNQQLTDAKAQMQQTVQMTQAQLAAMNTTLEAVRGEQQAQQTELAAYRQKQELGVTTLEQQMTQQLEQAQQAISERDVQLQELQQQIATLQQERDTLLTRISGTRISTEDPVTRQPDGRIIRVPSRNTVYVNLGQAESVTPGLTFEVYDKDEGIPPAGDPETDESLPKGKASIEVVRVGPISSEARVVRLNTGAVLTEGDLAANLVFDKNTRYNFFVYGKFDLDQNGAATAQDTDTLKRLITQFGGQIADTVNVSTDFVVLGKEPTLPAYSPEELQDPFVQREIERAQAELDQYAQIRQQAIQMKLPILNQNRFLYLIGYYELAQR